IIGGALTTWTYLGTGTNTSALYFDDQADATIVGGQTIDFTRFQPWPTVGLPASGTCNVAGTAVQWVSGTAFNVNWAPGSIIVVNGIATSLYAPPSSTTFLQINDTVGSGSGVPFYLPQPTLVGQTLPAI